MLSKCALVGLFEGCGMVNKCFIRLGITLSLDITIKWGSGWGTWLKYFFIDGIEINFFVLIWGICIADLKSIHVLWTLDQCEYNPAVMTSYTVCVCVYVCMYVKLLGVGEYKFGCTCLCVVYYSVSQSLCVQERQAWRKYGQASG